MKSYLIIIASFAFTHAAHASSSLGKKARSFTQSSFSLVRQPSICAIESVTHTRNTTKIFSNPKHIIYKKSTDLDYIMRGGYTHLYSQNYRGLQRMVLNAERNRQNDYRKFFLFGTVAAVACNIDIDGPVNIGFCPRCEKINQVNINEEGITEVNCVHCHYKFGVDPKFVMSFFENLEAITQFVGSDSLLRVLRAGYRNDWDALGEVVEDTLDFFLDPFNLMGLNPLGWMASIEKWDKKRKQRNINPRDVIDDAAKEIRKEIEAEYEKKVRLYYESLKEINPYLIDVEPAKPWKTLRTIEISRMLETSAFRRTMSYHPEDGFRKPTKKSREVETILQLIAIFSHPYGSELYPKGADEISNSDIWESYEPNTVIDLNKISTLLDKVARVQFLRTYQLLNGEWKGR